LFELQSSDTTVMFLDSRYALVHKPPKG